MRSSIVIIALLYSGLALAELCQRYHLIAGASKEGLVVARGTLSQRKFKIHTMASLKIVPYLDKTVEGDFIINADSVVLDADKLRLSISDPLNPINEIQKLTPVECPVFKVP